MKTVDHIRNVATVILILPIIGMMAGCGATLQTVKVAVPVQCQATEPTRPVMPTDMLLPGTSLDRFAQAAIAEIERREGYEGRLVAALQSCIAPVEK